MKFSRKATALALSLAMVASATAAFAAPGADLGGNIPEEAERKANGHTTISIMTAEKALENVSFEVPLYVTMAVIKGTADVAVPTNYQIKNTAAVGGRPIGVTALNFAKLAGSTFETKDAAPGTTELTKIQLKIGAVTMPTLTAAGSANANLSEAGSVFVDGTKGGKPKAILASATETENTLKLPLVGKVASATRTDVGAVAQFKVIYTVSALDANNNPMGTVYAGDDSFRAGLGDQKPTP